MELENFGCLAMDATDMIEIDGGFAVILGTAIGLAAGIPVGLLIDYWIN